MTSFRYRIVCVCLSIVATTGLVSFSDPAVAAPFGLAAIADVAGS